MNKNDRPTTQWSDSQQRLPALTDPATADDLALVIDHLAREVARMREQGPLSVQDAQQVAGALTRAQLMLNELERVELREHGFSRDMAEWFVALETGIRSVRDELYREMQSRRSLPPGKGDDAHDHAGR